MDALGVVGQDVFDVLCKDGDAEAIEKRLYRHLPDIFIRKNGYCIERAHGIGKIVEFCTVSVRIPDINAIPSIDFNVRGDSFIVTVLIRIRFKPEANTPARMLSSTTLRVDTLHDGGKTLFEHKFHDIDDAFDEIMELVV